MRTALGIPAHTDPVPPVASGPFVQLCSLRFSNVDNCRLRLFTGDSSVLDRNGSFTADEQRKTVVAGVDQPFVRNRSCWPGTKWCDCPMFAERNGDVWYAFKDTLPCTIRLNGSATTALRVALGIE